MGCWVSDEVWAELDHDAGRLPRRRERQLAVAPVILLLVLSAGVVVWRSGAVVPRVAWANLGYSASSDLERRIVTHSVAIANRGWPSVHITGVGRSGPGLELVEVRGSLPTTLSRGESTEVILVYRVTDCAAVPRGPWPVPVRVRRAWGTQTVYVSVPTESSPDAPDSYTFIGRDPYGVEWQRLLADRACGGPA